LEDFLVIRYQICGVTLKRRLLVLFIFVSSIIFLCGSVKSNPVATGPIYTGSDEFLSNPLRGLVVLLYINLPINTFFYVLFLMNANERVIPFFSPRLDDRMARIVSGILLISISGIFIDSIWLFFNNIPSFFFCLLLIFISLYIINLRIQKLGSYVNKEVSLFFVFLNFFGWGFIWIDLPDVSLAYTIISVCLISFSIFHFSKWYNKRQNFIKIILQKL